MPLARHLGRRLDAEIEFRAGAGASAGADQDQAGRVVAVLDDLATPGHLVGSGMGLVWHGVAAQVQDGGTIAVAYGHLIGAHGFVAVSWPDHQQVGDGPFGATSLQMKGSFAVLRSC